MKAGDILDVRWQGVNAPKIKAPGKRPDVLFPGYKIHPPRRATRTGHWHDESINHGQVGLAEDGRFAATR